MAKSRQLLLPFAHLRFSPDILRRLGEELNPNPDQGILELVKNSHDADASFCSIELENTSTAGGTVTITDDGIGMGHDEIENGWLLLGKSSKDSSVPTRLGRTPVGNKGLGRLAALRLGSIATLISCPEDDPGTEFVLKIDWTSYDSVDTVEEVELKIQTRKRKELKGHGTIIRIDNLQHSIQRSDVKRLARGILLLADPFTDDPSGFRPSLVAKEFDDLSRSIARRYFDDAEFHLIGQVSGNGQATARVLDWKGNELFRADHADLRKKKKDTAYHCPAAQFDLWNFILDKETFSTRTSTIQEVHDWLKEFGGVHLYLRGFRVPPYGNPGNDWLELNLRRSRSPEARPSTNNSIGRVSINDPGDHLAQKTDRSGIIEDEAFAELQVFAGEALDWMARRRLEEREAKRSEDRSNTKSKSSKAKESLDTAIESLPKNQQVDIKQAVNEYTKAQEKETSSLRKEVQLYRTLSTAGITAALFSHESKQPLNIIDSNVRSIKKALEKAVEYEGNEHLFRAIERLSGVADSLRAFSNLTLSQVDRDKRRTSRIQVHDVINKVASMFDRFIAQRKVKLNRVLAESNPYLRTSEAAIESIVTNLVMNSLQAFEKASPGNPEIRLRTLVTESLCIIVCEDSGPGIVDIRPREIWLPGETTRDNGTGLGLTIVRDTVVDLGGSVEAFANGSLGGAEIRITLPILGA